MNNQKSSNKSALIIGIIVVVAAIGFFYFQGKESPDDGLLSVQQTEPVTAQIIGLLNQIESLRIDTSIFRSVSYQTLREYPVTIPELNVGRPNPFAPVSGQSAGSRR
ncbi:MAG: hypothetical protein WC648_02605 [Candidatus Paceibacterota bacterium]|jgi:hypothetical protein